MKALITICATLACSVLLAQVDTTDWETIKIAKDFPKDSVWIHGEVKVINDSVMVQYRKSKSQVQVRWFYKRKKQ